MAGPGIDPMHQFLVQKLVEIPPLQIGGFTLDMSITNSVAMMMTAAVVLVAFLLAAGRGQVVPGRLQSAGEALYGIIDDVLVSPIIGPAGKPFIPFIFTIFMLVFTMNLMGVVLSVGALVGWSGLTFTPTAQLAVTATLALLTFFSVLVIGFIRNGLSMYKLVVPSGMNIGMTIMLFIIETISFLARPLTLAMRLFGNMLGGHVVLSIFGSFVVILGLFGMAGGIALLGFLGAGLSFALIVALTALELIVAFLQAFVFAALATVYLNEVVNLGHGH
jgi:F-type H+-transporting ATPase subunit a